MGEEMKILRGNVAITVENRYEYDFGVCSIAKGWAQIDTSQDASYFGQWVNPVLRWIFSYCEGDTTVTQCATNEELVSEIAKMKAWNLENGHRFLGIDPGFSVPLRSALVHAGLGEYLHPEYGNCSQEPTTRLPVADIRVNDICRVKTGIDSNAFRSPSAPDKVAPQITIGTYRARLHLADARDLVADVAEAIQVAEASVTAVNLERDELLDELHEHISTLGEVRLSALVMLAKALAWKERKQEDANG